MNNMNFKNEKAFRLINMYERLNKGEILYKTELANFFCVSEKTLLRDIADLRAYYANMNDSFETIILYDKKINGYYLKEAERQQMTNQEILAMCKILLESRAFNKKELNMLIEKLLQQASIKDSKEIKEIIRKELFYYVPLRHDKDLFALLWDLTLYINRKEYIKISKYFCHILFFIIIAQPKQNTID